ncbi:hypothetical protein NDU88_004449 [Pleurodeles waltl]|uniref:Uncharacterized protein n=1 Tax=Pleurodeles waltl TaxID=8319 RepID=A0AAV7W9R8_PLEWA|nr:hypothetical protein NDU88_004449 [Pleurodeles waltl]
MAVLRGPSLAQAVAHTRCRRNETLSAAKREPTRKFQRRRKPRPGSVTSLPPLYTNHLQKPERPPTTPLSL